MVWLCRTCQAGAATLPILREVASRDFVNHLWQAARHEGRRSALVCPSCARPFTEFMDEGTEVDPQQLEVCVRCYWVWLSPRTLSTLAARKPARKQIRALAPRPVPRLTSDTTRRRGRW